MTQNVKTGGCLCGAVRYQIEGPLRAVVICHCTHCTKQSGSAFSINVVTPKDQYKQQGATRVYEDRGDSGKSVFRHFCERCGSPILSDVASLDGVVIVKAGTLDDSSDLKPDMEVYAEHAAGWVPPITPARRFLRTPT